MAFLFHKLFMFMAALCILTGISAAAFFRHKRNWLKIHKFINSTGFMGLIAGIIMAFIFVSAIGGEHFEGIHPLIGLCAFFLTGVSLFLGFYQFRAKTKLQTIKIVHRWLGCLSLLLIITAYILGLRLAGII